MAYGGMTPYPRRLGGGEPRVASILKALNNARGTAYDTSNRESIVYLHNMAIARALAATWGTNTRLGYVWDPYRCPLEILARWERIMGVAPRGTVTERRARVAGPFERTGVVLNRQLLTDTLRAELGEAFVAVESYTTDAAAITVPDGSYPWGTPNEEYPWTSSVAKILVRMQKPEGWLDWQFYEATGRVSAVLDPLVPAWATIDWYRPGVQSEAVAGGPSAAGFYIDDENNLDNQVFE